MPIRANPLTIWVARTLFRNGAVFLADVFGDNEALAKAVNNLLVVGFYLLNLGFVVLYVRTGRAIWDLTGLLDTLSVKIGIVMLVLGVLHLSNVLVFNGIRRRSRQEALRTPPLPPQGFVPGPGLPPYAAPGRPA